MSGEAVEKLAIALKEIMNVKFLREKVYERHDHV